MCETFPTGPSGIFGPSLANQACSLGPLSPIYENTLFFCYIALPLALPVSLEMRTFRKRWEGHCGLTWKWDGGTLDDLLTSSNSPSHTFPHRFHLTGPVLLQNVLRPDALQCNHPSRRKCLLPLVPSCNKVSETPLHCALIDTLIRGNYWSTI